LISEGYVNESVTLKVMESGKEEQIIQKLGNGEELLLTGIPVKHQGEIKFIVCTELYIDETLHLIETFSENINDNREDGELYPLEEQYPEIIKDSQSMKTVVRRAHKIAHLDTTVLLTGESGTGKEVIANLIYKNSIRKGKPFIKVNCAAIPDSLLESEFFGYEKGAFTGADRAGKLGMFELANEGTLFLDEIGDLPIMMQAKLLRAIQEQEIMRVGGKTAIKIDTRIIASTNKELKSEISRGNFREDLYYRLNVFPIEIPPLRSRIEDINGLAYHFTNLFNKRYSLEKTITESAIKALTSYNWPGNVREFRNIIERIVVDAESDEINKFHVINHLKSGRFDRETSFYDLNSSLDMALKNYEKEIILNLMAKYNNASRVAEILRVNKSTISKKMKKYSIESQE
jgi:transcriptional regulator with PAS, ATPase and Fis domain